MVANGSVSVFVQTSTAVSICFRWDDLSSLQRAMLRENAESASFSIPLMNMITGQRS
jgi:hypothetical protein